MKVKTIIIIFFIILLFLCVGFGSYKVGQENGVIHGMVITQDYHNLTLCDLLNETRENITSDEDGYCILGERKYEESFDCYYGKFKIKGSKIIPWYGKIELMVENIILYPFYLCWPND